MQDFVGQEEIMRLVHQKDNLEHLPDRIFTESLCLEVRGACGCVCVCVRARDGENG